MGFPGQFLSFFSIRLVRELPSKLLEVVAPQGGADGQRSNYTPRNKEQKERVTEGRQDVIDLLGAPVEAPIDHPGAFHETGIGDVELVRKKGARGEAGNCYAAGVELIVSLQWPDRDMSVVGPALQWRKHCYDKPECGGGTSERTYNHMFLLSMHARPVRTFRLSCKLDLPPSSGGDRSEDQAAFRMVIASMLARASAGVR